MVCNVTRLYRYSQDGDLLQAVVNGVTTTFAYDGNGQRLQMSVDGAVTTFLPDYGSRGRRILWEQGAEETKHYLYGVACLGEHVTDNAAGDTEWRYYQRDGSTLVRQTTNQTAAITLAWTFSPEGGVVLGEEGPVTHLGCQDDAVYDWSTGLIFKNGNYFDPNTGIWITLGGLVVWNERQTRPEKRRRKGRRKCKRLYILLLILLGAVILLAGCTQPTPPATATCTPTFTPMPPSLPPNAPELPKPTDTPPTLEPTLPPTQTPGPPTLTPTQPPTNTPMPPPTNTPTPTLPPTPTPPPTSLWLSSPVRTNGNLPDWVQWYGYTEFARDRSIPYSNNHKIHAGLDFGVYYNQFQVYLSLDLNPQLT